MRKQPAETSVSMEETVYRIRVVENILSRGGIPLSKVDSLSGLSEEN